LKISGKSESWEAQKPESIEAKNKKEQKKTRNKERI
jgi:hypothetical protein